MSYHGKKTKHERSTLDIAFYKVCVPFEKTVSMLSLTLPQLITLFTGNTWQIYTFVYVNCNGRGSKTSIFVQVQSTLHIVMWSAMFEVNSAPQLFAPIKEIVTEEGKFF
jgi:hypothetical protein